MDRRKLTRRDLAAWSVLAASLSWMATPGAWAAPAERAQPGPKPAPPTRAPRRTVVVDPGHGGQDPGAIGVSGNREKAIVLAVALELEALLAASGRYRVVLTRRSDQFVALRDRVLRARSARADVFLSLHADHHPQAATRGATVYTVSDEASDRESAALATRENKSDLVAGMDLSRHRGDAAAALLAMTQRGTNNESHRLAETIVGALERRGVALLPRSHRQAGFAVLTAPDVPAALVELGYLSNPLDERLLVQRAHQRRLAQALAEAVDIHCRGAPPAPAAKKT